MEKHEIRLCKIEEKNKLQDFIKNHWNAKHIFVKNKEMLDFQHLDKEEQQYNFVVAYNQESQEFDAILGFIPLNLYDKKLKANEFWLALWKVKEKCKGVGLKVFTYFMHNFKPDFVAAIGISEDAKRIYRAFRWKIGVLEHFYIKNPKLRVFNIATFKLHENEEDLQRGKTFVLKSLNYGDIKLCSIFHPLKSMEFIKNRFLAHPVYHYDLYGVFKGEKPLCIFVVRSVEVLNAKVLRIVDFLGEFPEGSRQEFRKIFEDLLLEKNAEYVDFLCFSERREQILNMGFSLKKEEEVLPNYFEPFLKQNVAIEFAYKSRTSPNAIFKADADQDRPSIVRGGG